MKIEDVTFPGPARWVTIWLPTSKGDQEGRGVRRTLRCASNFQDVAFVVKDQATPPREVESFAAPATPALTAMTTVHEEVASSQVCFHSPQPPRELWVVTKGRGWKGRPRHRVTKASWNVTMSSWMPLELCCQTSGLLLCFRSCSKARARRVKWAICCAWELVLSPSSKKMMDLKPLQILQREGGQQSTPTPKYLPLEGGGLVMPCD